MSIIISLCLVLVLVVAWLSSCSVLLLVVFLVVALAYAHGHLGRDCNLASKKARQHVWYFWHFCKKEKRENVCPDPVWKDAETDSFEGARSKSEWKLFRPPPSIGELSLRTDELVCGDPVWLLLLLLWLCITYYILCYVMLYYVAWILYMHAYVYIYIHTHVYRKREIDIYL